MIQYLTFGLYFLLISLVGWVSLKQTQDESDFWIAGGKLGWLMGGATLAATHTSAGTYIGTLGVMYTAGWSFGWLVLSIPLAYWFVAAVLAPRFTRVRELTLPSFIESRYGSPAARGVAATIILIAMVVYIQAQIVAGGLIANIAFGLPVTTGMLIFTAILLGYTVVGGMIAVVYTDVVQLGIMILGAMFSVPLAMRHLGGVDNLIEYVQVVNPITFTWEGLPPTLLFTMGMAFMLGSVATPEKLIRLYAMKDMRTIRRAVLLTIVVVTTINLMVFFVGLSSTVLFPLLPTGDLAMPMIARAVLPSAIGALMLAAITAAMMSTVDSLLIVAGSALSYDIYQRLINPSATERQKLVIGRVGIFVTGTVPVLLLLAGVGRGELVQFIVLLFSALMGASFFMPVVGGVFWRRANKNGAIAAMLGGIIGTFAWKLFGTLPLDPVVPGFLTSAVLFVGVSLLTAPPPRELASPYFDPPPAPVTAF